MQRRMNVLELKSLETAISLLEKDTDITRLTARVFFTRNLETYYNLIDYLSNRADMTIHLSDPDYCKGQDTFPNLKYLLEVLDQNNDKSIVVPHLGEYLRFGKIVERSANWIYSILNRHVHSSTRVWLPLFLAENVFDSVVGSLDEERFGQYVLLIDEPPTEFNVTVYSSIFDSKKNGIDANGIREWFSKWDEKGVITGMSFSTRYASQMEESDGDYTITIIEEPFEYICQLTNCYGVKKSIGSREQWLSLIPFLEDGASLEQTINKALNLFSFDPVACLSKWDTLSDDEKWLLKLRNEMYPDVHSYYSYALTKAQDIGDLPESLQLSILDCTHSQQFDEWVKERRYLLNRLKGFSYGPLFWKKLKTLDDDTQLRVLSADTHIERTIMIEIVSKKLKQGASLTSVLSAIHEQFPELALYLSKVDYIGDNNLRDYIEKYKVNKVINEYSKELSKQTETVDFYDFDTRNSFLNNIMHTTEAYYLWMDGMGLEWLDLLFQKIKEKDNTLPEPKVWIGTAAIPTVTSVNMDKMDPKTLSGKKYDKLDHESHIKDKSDINYYSLIAKQFEIVDTIAEMIVAAAKDNPTKDIVVTADHGMSRNAALGFHYGHKTAVPTGADVFNFGRYCKLNGSKVSVPNTKKVGDYLAFTNHDHFVASGFAPGEIHGGVTPEEVLVPVIHYSRKSNHTSSSVTYSLLDSNIYRNNDGLAELLFETSGPVESALIDINGMKVKAFKISNDEWKASIPGLELDTNYKARVVLNNFYTNKEELITIKRKGLEIDDDFDLF